MFFYLFYFCSQRIFHFWHMESIHFGQVHFWTFPNKENAISVIFHLGQVLTYCTCDDFSTATLTYYICFWGRKIPPIQWGHKFLHLSKCMDMPFCIMLLFCLVCVYSWYMLCGCFCTWIASFSCLLHARFISCHDMLCSELIKLVNMPT